MSAVVFGSRIRMMTAANRYDRSVLTLSIVLEVGDLPWDCTQRFEHEERSSSNQVGNRG